MYITGFVQIYSTLSRVKYPTTSGDKTPVDTDKVPVSAVIVLT